MKRILPLLFVVFPVWAGEHIATLAMENDLFTGTGDSNYTNGARASWLDADNTPPEFARQIANLLPMFEGGKRMLVQYSIGQNMYTPANIKVAAPQPSDHPWAGFLYGSIGMTQAQPDLRRVDDVELSLGMVGPAAMAESAQKLIHRNMGAPIPQGWDNQLDNELAGAVAWQRRWPMWWEQSLGETKLSFTPHVGTSLGNLYTYGAVGGTLRWMPENGFLADNPVRVRPAMPGTGYFETDDNLNWMFFVGAEQRLVGRNIFLDGNTFGSTPQVQKRNFVTDLQAGVSLTWQRYQIGYTAVHRSKEFFGQPDAQTFGAITLSMKF